MPGTFSNLTADMWRSIPLLHRDMDEPRLPAGEAGRHRPVLRIEMRGPAQPDPRQTLVQGDVLIDDKGIMTGAATPTWQHLIHDQSHNKSVTGVPTMADWRGWRGHVYPLPERVPV